jgi:hypothetical protein
MSNGWKAGRGFHVFGSNSGADLLFLIAARFGSRFTIFLSELVAMGL